MEKFRQFKKDNGSSAGPVKPTLRFGGGGHHTSNSVNICIPNYSVNLSRARNAAGHAHQSSDSATVSNTMAATGVGRSLQSRAKQSMDFKFSHVGRE